MRFPIDEDRWKVWERLYSGMTLGDGFAKDWITFENKTYVISGIRGDVLYAECIVPLSEWHGLVLAPKDNHKIGKTFYDNLKVKSGGKWWVVVPDGEVEFEKVVIPHEIQASLF